MVSDNPNPGLSEHQALDILKDNALREIISAVDPFMVRTNTGSPRPYPLRIENETPQSLHFTIAIDDGSVVLTAHTRVKDPEPQILVIPPNDAKDIDLTKR